MALSSATLSTALQAATPSPSAATAAATIADAYGAYMTAAVANSVTILSAGIAAAESAMAAAMSFSAGDSAAAGAGKFAAGISAFWGVLSAAPATYWAGATIITPPTFSGMTSAMSADFTSNTDDENTLIQSMDAIAASIHAGTLTGPTVTIPPNTWGIT